MTDRGAFEDSDDGEEEDHCDDNDDECQCQCQCQCQLSEEDRKVIEADAYKRIIDEVTTSMKQREATQGKVIEIIGAMMKEAVDSALCASLKSPTTQ